MKNSLLVGGYSAMAEQLAIKPYARLITMLGDQLIKNELIALSELIKNAYDADASWVKVSFIDFNDDFSKKETSKIIIEDDGNGMNAEIIKKHWLNPATPEKLRRKAENLKTQSGRILQGEKGIGRFAIFKLGKNITITTRRQKQNDTGIFIEGGCDSEFVLHYDFSKYDNDFLTENGTEKDLFLDSLSVSLETLENPVSIIKKEMVFGATKRIRKEHGTIIEISDLKTNWSRSRIERLKKEVGKLQPIFSNDNTSDFSVWLYRNEDLVEGHDEYKKKLNNCLQNKSVFKITNGAFVSKEHQISFDINGRPLILSLEDPEIKGLDVYKKHFTNLKRDLECGDFNFEFYIFDLNSNSVERTKYYLDKEEIELIKEHRIYLYRDGLRVMPYGDPSDDWLGIDIARGTIRATEFLSNDQVVGCVYISQEKNPLLRDKTNREGLIDEGHALEDFIGILQVILRYLRTKPFAQYLIEKNKKAEINRVKNGIPLEIIDDAKKQFAGDEKALKFIKSFETSYSKEKQVYEDRIKKTENLAAVGLSVETASHDMMIFLRRALETQDSLIQEITFGEKIDKERLIERLTLIKGNLSIIENQMKDVQLLFPSTKSKTKNINVLDIVNKVYNLYRRACNDSNIEVDITSTIQPLIAKTTDAVLLQVFINLFDNSLYWLKTVNRDRRISIAIDGNQQRLIFSDNGPGVRDEDKDYIFEAFYSGKGQDGRGLGLYIARQLLDRYDYSIDLAEFSSDKKLLGANFVLEFIREE